MSNNVDLITVDQAKNLLKDSNTVFLDVRKPSEVAAMRIPGSLHIELSDLQIAALPKDILEKDIILYCAHGSRSLRGCLLLKDHLREGQVKNLSGGIFGWKAEEGPVEGSEA